jgi:anti-sigma factor RsiW
MNMHPTNLEISEYIDGSLSPASRDAIRRHVEGCQDCRALVSDLDEIRRAALALPPVEPPAAVWGHVEQAIRRRLQDVRGTRGWGWGWLATAAALLMAIGVVVRMGYFAPGRATTAAPDEVPTAQSIEAELALAEQHYQKAITGLEQIAGAEKGALDADTTTTLQNNLAILDQAITESRAALRAQPSSEPAQQSLLDSFKAKVSLLQDTIGLINELRKGNEAGAARIVSGLKRGA